MKRSFIILIAVFTGCISFAQTNEALRQNILCNYYGEAVPLPSAPVSSSEEAQRAIAAIMDVVGLESNFEVKEAAIPNAAAVIYDKKRFILYNPAFISRINNASGDRWASVAILAHEIGHHLDGHTLSGNGSHPDTELQADAFSGFVLRKMGATLEQAQSALKVVANTKATETHPGKADRLLSIDNGWSKSDAQLTGKTFTAKALSTAAEEKPATPAANLTYALSPEFVNFNVYFTADPDNKYYITKDNRLVMLKEGTIVLLGKMVRSESDDYPFALKLSDTDYYLVSRAGNLLTKAGKKAGYLRG